jgi:hypothetical protein
MKGENIFQISCQGKKLMELGGITKQESRFPKTRQIQN